MYTNEILNDDSCALMGPGGGGSCNYRLVITSSYGGGGGGHPISLRSVDSEQVNHGIVPDGWLIVPARQTDRQRHRQTETDSSCVATPVTEHLT